MNLVVANDDGIDDQGIWMLAEQLAAVGSVSLYAPARNYSGAGMSIKLQRTFDLNSFPAPEWFSPNIPAFSVDAPPATVAAIGTAHAFGGNTHAVISGINAGWNPGAEAYKVSGTVGAAKVAVERGLLGIAISAAGDGRSAYPAIALATRRMLLAIQEAFDQLPNVLVNVNIPASFSADSQARLTSPGLFTVFSDLMLKNSTVEPCQASIELAYGDYFSSGSQPEEELSALADGMVAVSVTGRSPGDVLLDHPWPAIVAEFRP
ncbi:MAG: hypothetical protein CMO68_00135 [Verrucomicrobiales bacterium]|nr:hypothetical protein [Verrucomicrobiales bacterium]